MPGAPGRTRTPWPPSPGVGLDAVSCLLGVRRQGQGEHTARVSLLRVYRHVAVCRAAVAQAEPTRASSRRCRERQDTRCRHGPDLEHSVDEEDDGNAHQRRQRRQLARAPGGARHGVGETATARGESGGQGAGHGGDGDDKEDEKLLLPLLSAAFASAPPRPRPPATAAAAHFRSRARSRRMARRCFAFGAFGPRTSRSKPSLSSASAASLLLWW